MIYAVNKRTKEHVEVIDDGAGPFGFDLGWVIVQADDAGWIPWDGGECPLPDLHPVDIKMDDGSMMTECDPEDWGWEHMGPDCQDIIAYRPILDEPRQATMGGAKLWQDAEGTIPVLEGDPVGRVGEPPAWDGEGPARIGDRVACISSPSNEEFEIIHWHDGLAWLRDIESGWSALYPLDELRPIRSAEDRAVEEMMESLRKSSGASGTARICRTLYRAGYRKVSND